jgi:hypothetical protein
LGFTSELSVEHPCHISLYLCLLPALEEIQTDLRQIATGG